MAFSVASGTILRSYRLRLGYLCCMIIAKNFAIKVRGLLSLH